MHNQLKVFIETFCFLIQREKADFRSCSVMWPLCEAGRAVTERETNLSRCGQDVFIGSRSFTWAVSAEDSYKVAG